jgi:hypothetical protein
MQSLADGNLPQSPITAQVIPAQPKTGKCPQTMADLMKWMSGFGIQFTVQDVAFAYSAGPAAKATPNSKSFLRLLFDDQRRFLGAAVWDTTLGAWNTGGQIGELKTIIRAAGTLVADMTNRGYPENGWHLADGSTAGVPDLTANTGFFTGAGPNWDIYTVAYTGA